MVFFHTVYLHRAPGLSNRYTVLLPYKFHPVHGIEVCEFGIHVHSIPLPSGTGGLKKSSFVLGHQITTLDRSKITEKMGELDPGDLHSLLYSLFKNRRFAAGPSRDDPITYFLISGKIVSMDSRRNRSFVTPGYRAYSAASSRNRSASP